MASLPKKKLVDTREFGLRPDVLPRSYTDEQLKLFASRIRKAYIARRQMFMHNVLRIKPIYCSSAKWDEPFISKKNKQRGPIWESAAEFSAQNALQPEYMVEVTFDSYLEEMLCPMPSQIYGDRVLGLYRKRYSDASGAQKTGYNSGETCQCRHYKCVDRYKMLRREFSLSVKAGTLRDDEIAIKVLLSPEAAEQLTAMYRSEKLRRLVVEGLSHGMSPEMQKKYARAIKVVGPAAAVEYAVSKFALEFELDAELRLELAETDHFKRSQAFWAKVCAEYTE